jgi:uncharacterized membrane protein
MELSQKEILMLFHLIFLAFFVGGQLVYLFILQPVSYRFFSTNDQLRFLKNILRVQNPVLMLALCLVVISGGFMITPLKGSLGSNYFAAFGTQLVTKLEFFLLVFFVTVYQTLAIDFKIRYLDPAKELKNIKAKLNHVRWQMSITCVLNILLTVYIIFIARNF